MKSAEQSQEQKVEQTESGTAVSIRNLNFYYGSFHAVRDVSIDFPASAVTALIGPSGCGKSTVLRTINRMNELIPETRTEGEILYHGVNIYALEIDAVDIRRRIGMVFQRPNPFPKSIFENVAWGARLNGYRGDMEELVENCLRRTALWEEVKDKLKQSAMRLSGGQQQRLCIARAIAVEPEVLLMDEPASALDPISTAKIEDLIDDLKKRYTIVIVTHNMQQAGRVSDRTAFFMVDDDRSGYLVEYGDTKEIFFNPQDSRTEAYISGRFG